MFDFYCFKCLVSFNISTDVATKQMTYLAPDKVKTVAQWRIPARRVHANKWTPSAKELRMTMM